MKSGEREAYLPGFGNTEDSSNNGSGFGGFTLLLFFFLLLCFFFSQCSSLLLLRLRFVRSPGFFVFSLPQFFVLGRPPSLCFRSCSLFSSFVFFPSVFFSCLRFPPFFSRFFLWFFFLSLGLYFALPFIRPRELAPKPVLPLQDCYPSTNGIVGRERGHDWVGFATDFPASLLNRDEEDA